MQYVFLWFCVLQAKAILASDDTNCISDFCVEESRELALRLRDHVKPEDRGPLHGIPISVKECFNVAGYDNTIGLVKYINCPARSDAPFIQVLCSYLLRFQNEYI